MVYIGLASLVCSGFYGFGVPVVRDHGLLPTDVVYTFSSSFSQGSKYWALAQEASRHLLEFVK